MFVRFQSAVDRNQAVASNPSFLSDNMLIGVCALEQDLAERLGFQMSEDGRTVRVADGVIGVTYRKRDRDAIHRRRPYHMYDDRGVMVPPRRYVNPCKRIMRYIFGW